MLRLTTVGTGTVSPSASRVCAGHLIEGHEVRVLLDCGSGVVHRLAQLGIDWRTVSHVALTHFHPDHTLDLPLLLFALRYGSLEPRTTPLTIVGPVGTDAWLTSIDAAVGGVLRTLGFSIDVIELDDGGSLLAGPAVVIEARRVPHTANSVAYSVGTASGRIVYTGDTGFDAALGEWAFGCDVLLAECSLPARLRLATHLTPEECGELARLAQPHLLALTHFYPPVEEVDIRAIVGTRFAGAVILTEDGWSTVIQTET